MKIKKLIFLSLVLGLVVISGCTSSTKITGGGGSVKASLLNILDIVIGWSDQKFIFQVINNRMKITLDPFRARLLLGIALLTSWMLIYGFLSELRIFGRGKTALYLILSFLIAETGSITGIIPWVALFMYTAINAWSIIVFSLMFFVGTWYLYKKRSTEWGTAASVAGAYHEDMKGLKGELAGKRLELVELRRKIVKTANPDRRASLETREEKVKEELQSLKDRIQELAQSYRS